MPDKKVFQTGARSGGSDWNDAPPQFSVLVAYDTPANADHAMRFVNGLAGLFGSEIEFLRDLRRFDIITLLGSGDLSGGDGVNADLLVVAADGKKDLPASVKDWVKAWAMRGDPDGAALVALLATQESGPSPARDCLKALATKAGMDFFVREFQRPSDEINAAIGGIHHRAVQSSTVLRGILDQGHSPWQPSHAESRHTQG